MYNASQAFMDMSLSSQRELVSKLTIVQGGNTWELDSNDIRGGSIIVSSSCMNKSFELGSVTASSLSVSLDNRDGRWNDIPLDGATVFPHCGYVLPDGTEEYVPMGIFIVDKPNRPYGTFDIKAADRLILLDEPLADLPISYPLTQNALLNAISTHCNVPLSTSILALPNINENAVHPTTEDMTCRDAVSEIALMQGGFARMDRSGQLEIVVLENPYASLDPHEMPVGSRTALKQLTDEIIITGMKYDKLEWGTNGYMLEVEPLELLDPDKASLILGNVWQSIINFTYIAYDADYYGNPALDCGDVVHHMGRDGKNILSLITSHTYKHGGSCKMKAEGESVTAVNYKTANARRLARAVSRLSADVDNKLTSYEQAQAQLNDMLTQMIGLHETVEELPDGSNVIYKHNNPVMEESDTIWRFDAQGLFFSSDGGVSWDGITTNSTLIIKIIETIGINAEWINLTDGSDLEGNLTQIKAGQLNLEGRVEGVETHTARLDVQVSSIQTEVSALGGSNIISNILGEFGVMDWTFESAAWEFQSVAPYPLFGTGLLFGGVNTQIMYPILPDTLSGKGFRIFNAGKALSEYAVAEGGANYSFYTRYRGTGTVTFLLREYNTATPLNKDSFTRETAYGTTSAVADWTTANGTIELLPDTQQVILVVDSQVSVRDGEFLETSDTSVNMGNPRTYSPSLTDINTKATYAVTIAEQTAEGFTLLAADQRLIEGRVSNAETQISIQAGQISTKVERDGVISSINQTPETIKIQAEKIKLEGTVTANNNFKILTDGTIEAVNGKFTGNVTATSGVIGGFNVDNYVLRSTTSGRGVQISGNGGVSPIWIGDDRFVGHKFKVEWSGKVYATDIDITGGSINLGGGAFSVSPTGALISNNALITGGRMEIPDAGVGEGVILKEGGGGFGGTRLEAGRLLISSGSLRPTEVLPDGIWAAGFYDFTPAYRGNALSEISQIKDDGKGGIDHKSLPKFAQKRSSKGKGLSKQSENLEPDSRDMGAMISILTKAVQELTVITTEHSEQIQSLITKEETTCRT